MSYIHYFYHIIVLGISVQSKYYFIWSIIAVCVRKINFYYSIRALRRWNSNAMKLIYIVMLGYSFILHMFIKSVICTRCQITNRVFVSSRSCHLHQKGTWNTAWSDRNAWKSADILSSIWFDDCFIFYHLEVIVLLWTKCLPLPIQMLKF